MSNRDDMISSDSVMLITGMLFGFCIGLVIGYWIL